MRLDQEELERWGRRIGRSVETPAFLAIRGPLGAGKSVLARAVARGAGVGGAIPSPTFSLVLHYRAPSGTRVTHLDLYRIGSPDEVRELGWEELGRPDEIVLVEWPERAGELLPRDRWDVELRRVPDRPELREISVERRGDPPELPELPELPGRAGAVGQGPERP